MKLLVAFLLLIPSTTFAKDKTFDFTWTRPSGKIVETLRYKTAGKDWAAAYEKAAFFCVDFFQKGQHVPEEQVLEIIDVCANPLEKK